MRMKIDYDAFKPINLCLETRGEASLLYALLDAAPDSVLNNFAVDIEDVRTLLGNLSEVCSTNVELEVKIYEEQP